MYEGAATKMYLPLSPLYRQLLFIFTLCSQSHVFFPALCTSEPGLLQYTHAMKSPKPENAPFEGQHFKLLHSLLKTTQLCQDLLFFCLQYCFSCRIIVTKREFGSMLECAPYSCLCSHQLRSHGSIYLWLVCHVYEFEKGFSPQRV